jgi:L-rhamnose-H+ transport protein
MEPNPFLGVVLHAIGGLAAASFYIPYRRVKNWSWETYWLAGGFFSWIIAPWVAVLVIAPQSLAALREVDTQCLVITYGFGILWGVGGLTFGLTMRYLGISLGYAIALGFCAAFGTLIPPLYEGKIDDLLGATSGQVVFLGVGVCLAGIAASGWAGMSKERELSDEQKKKSVKEFHFVKGLVVAIFCGILSASMAYAFAAGKPIAKLALEHGTPGLWQNLPVLPVVLAGGFTTNFIWCVLLNFKNRTGREYFRRVAPEGKRVPLLSNFIFCALAGTTWYLQFFFYSMGTTRMGEEYDFSSWTLHMASIIIFSTLWGIALREWRGTGRRTRLLIAAGLFLLIASTVVVGYGNYLGANP